MVGVGANEPIGACYSRRRTRSVTSHADTRSIRAWTCLVCRPWMFRGGVSVLRGNTTDYRFLIPAQPANSSTVCSAAEEAHTSASASPTGKLPRRGEGPHISARITARSLERSFIRPASSIAETACEAVRFVTPRALASSARVSGPRPIRTRHARGAHDEA